MEQTTAISKNRYVCVVKINFQLLRTPKNASKKFSYVYVYVLCSGTKVILISFNNDVLVHWTDRKFTFSISRKCIEPHLVFCLFQFAVYYGLSIRFDEKGEKNSRFITIYHPSGKWTLAMYSLLRHNPPAMFICFLS